MQNDKSATSVNITKSKIENKNYAESRKVKKKKTKRKEKKKKSQDVDVVAGLNKSTRIMHFLAVNKNKVTRTSSRDCKGRWKEKERKRGGATEREELPKDMRIEVGNQCAGKNIFSV